MDMTRRFSIDVGRKCNINCRFCYHHHLGDLRKQTYRPVDDLKKDIDSGIARGNNYFDFTGGEPSLHPQIIDLIKYGLSKNVKSCLITNGLAGHKTYQDIIDAGIDDFLISIHGIENTHDYLIDFKDGFKKQERTIKQILDNQINLRFNTVINRYNQLQLLDMSKYMARFNPYIVNFINMNLHHKWRGDIAGKDIIANINLVEPILNESINYLEDRNIKVNVRYYPMCRIAKENYKNICNYTLVLFDPYEWDYSIFPKTRYQEWINEEKKNIAEIDPCKECDLYKMCGGTNKYHHAMSKEAGYGEIYKPQKIENIDKNDLMYFRKYNESLILHYKE